MMRNEMNHTDFDSFELHKLIRSGVVRFAGNKRLRIYGRLNCQSGKRMKIINRVFFSSAEDALAAGYRPCRKCMLRKDQQQTREI